MEEFISYIKGIDYKKLIFPLSVILLYLIGFSYLFYLYKGIKNDKNVTTKKNEPITYVSTSEDNILSNEKIFVDIKGSVNKPGVYELDSGKRVYDVIVLAGGLKKDANTRFINLSQELKDGDVIVIYSEQEILDAKKEDRIVVNTPCICEEVKNDSCIKDSLDNKNNQDISNNNDSSDSNNKTININQATKEELMSLNGIGEAKANSILEYRNTNGLFKTKEELMNVSGISETIFEKIKENITI